jgi:LDH2 family malate/lactate/ureidoglycolate dehydrogenase
VSGAGGRVGAEDLRRYCAAVLAAAGWRPDDAALGAGALVETALRGIDSHGPLALLPGYAGDRPRGAAPRVAHADGAVAVVDGADALGLRAGALAAALAVQGAREHGVGAVAARRLGYLGALWWFVEPGARDGCIVLAACTSQACVVPHGGVQPLHGTNPIAVAVPATPEPIVVDMRTSALRMADYWAAVRAGGPLPGGALVASDGAPVRDVAAADDAAHLPLAGAKGYALALVVDVLAAALAGGPIGRELDAGCERDDVSAFFLALDPARFGAPDAFADAVSRLVRQVRETAPADPAQPVRLPGERAFAERRRRLRDGIPVDPVLRERMEAALAAQGIQVPFPDAAAGGAR